MKKQVIKIDEEFIRLDNLLKFSGITATGGQAKFLIQSEKVKLNGEICNMRGKKIRKGDFVTFEDNIIEVS